MLAIREQQVVEEKVICTIQLKQIHSNITFIGYVETNVGVLCIGEKLRIEFKWNIETEWLLGRMKEEKDVFKILNLIEAVRQFDLYA